MMAVAGQLYIRAISCDLKKESGRRETAERETKRTSRDLGMGERMM